MTDTGERMRPGSYDIRKTGAFTVIRICEEVHSQMDFSWLRELIEQLCGEGTCRIALQFDSGSYLYSKIITMLVACSKIIRASGGELAVVEPGKYVLGTLKNMNLHATVITVYRTESDLRNGIPLRE